MNNQEKEYTFLWFIENYSYCRHKTAESLESPEFTFDGLEGTAWSLMLYPRGKKVQFQGNISLHLMRSRIDDGPEEITLKYELSVLATNGSPLCTNNFEKTLTKDLGYGNPEFLRMDEVLLLRKADYLPEDTLSVRCKIWRGEGVIERVTQISARTRIGIERLSFLHVLEGFSALEPNEKKNIQIKSSSEKGCGISSSIYFSDEACCGEKIMVEIAPSSSNQILSKCELSILDRAGKLIVCGQADNRFDVAWKEIREFSLSLRRQQILNRKSEYLSDDKLSLSCECIFSTGVEYSKIEKTLYETPFATIDDNGGDHDTFAENLSNCPSALDDFKALYNKQLLTDVELKTKTNSFRAHKILLCARSPVLEAMLTNDMKEKNSNSISVDDLEDDIVQQFLLFLYSDSLDNLQWESAIKLYYVADKYDVEKLKRMCSIFLVDNVTTSSVSELLLLADTHYDCDLKKASEDFIFKHEKEVYGSEEWGKLIETNPILVSNTMLLIHKRKL